MTTTNTKTKEQKAVDELSVSNRKLYDELIGSGATHRDAMIALFGAWV